MPEPSKITLSTKELLMVQDAAVILTKQRIIENAAELFGRMVAEINGIFGGLRQLPVDVRASVPKISKGEQYLGLPYVILDYPRVFRHDDVFAIRTMFWWGNFFSVTLQLSGQFKEMLSEKCLNNLERPENLFVGVNTDPWQHHFGADNYKLWVRLNFIERRYLFEELDTVKIAFKFPLTDWNIMPEKLTAAYETLAKLLSFQDDEIGLSPDTPKADSDP